MYSKANHLNRIILLLRFKFSMMKIIQVFLRNFHCVMSFLSNFHAYGGGIHN
jgi:hypothetical protein